MADLFRMASDPLGQTFDLMVPCPNGNCIEGKFKDRGDNVRFGPRADHAYCNGTGLVPNPVITEPCETCGGQGHLSPPHPPRDWGRSCSRCDGRGSRVAASIPVPERVRVDEYPEPCNEPCIYVSRWDLRGYKNPSPYPDIILALDPMADAVDISHLWEQPCPCVGMSDDECAECPGTILVPPSPGEVWEIGWRDCELLPVLYMPPHLDSTARHEGDCLVLHEWGIDRVTYPPDPDDGDGWDPVVSERVTAHFPDGVKPGQWAGVCGELHLYDKAVKR